MNAFVRSATALAIAVGAGAGMGMDMDAATIANAPAAAREAAAAEIVSSIVIAPDFDRRRHEAALFVARYSATEGTGSVTAHRVPAGSDQADPAGFWGDRPGPHAGPTRPHSTASLMDAQGNDWPTARVVLSHRPASAGQAAGGIPWEWPALSETQRHALGGAKQGPALLAYLRGDRSREGAGHDSFPLRGSRHGAIVHSRLWFQPALATYGNSSGDQGAGAHADLRRALGERPAMLYVGAHDGLLHGFDAATGQERIAYLPEGLHHRLADLGRPGHRPAARVDGSPLTGELLLDPAGGRDAAASWRSYLAGFPGAGGPGYFVLDVTRPQDFSAAEASRLVIVDRTEPVGMDPDIGRIEGEPAIEAGKPSVSRQIARLNDGRWALVMGNGSHSAGGRAVLLIQYLDGMRELRRIVADPSPANGLAVPRLIDLDGDGRIDVAYAGDLQGNLWKFDLSAAKPGDWALAFGGTPFFVARDGTPGAARQPIASAPVWQAHPEGGLMLAFGTGRRPPMSDPEDRQPQTVYGLRDDTPVRRRSATGGAGSGPIKAGRAALVAQTLHTDARGEWGTLSTHGVHYGGSNGRRGWFIDLPVPRERVLSNPSWFDGRLIDVWSEVPASPAEADRALPPPPLAEYRTTLDILDGSAPRSQLYEGAPAAIGAQASRVARTPAAALRGVRSEVRVAAPGAPAPPTLRRPARTLRRPSWRQLQ